MQEKEKYIDFAVAPYALPDVCEALYNNGVTNAFLTLDDDYIHVRWRYDISRKFRTKETKTDPSATNNK